MVDASVVNLRSRFGKAVVVKSKASFRKSTRTVFDRAVDYATIKLIGLLLRAIFAVGAAILAAVILYWCMRDD